MPSAAPEGEAAPTDGALPAQVREGADERDLGIYLHVPFCAVRCGYCDFNTYTATELGGGASQRDFAATATEEIELAARVVDAAGVGGRRASTVFVGGGTPTVLPPQDLSRLLGAVRDAFGLAADAEVTTEANPDSVDAADLHALAGAGFTRVSFGMQSAVPHVLATLDRTHDPQRVPQVVRWAREAGLGVSLDLIYGTPGESLDDWATTVEAALACRPDHVSAYALVVEPGTKLAARVHRGQVEPVDDDAAASAYELVDQRLADAGYAWYEVSNWALSPELACRHNLGYWRGEDWWGVGPGAHSHVGGVRWWNVRHPSEYAARLRSGRSPAQAREVLDVATRALEDVMLRVRLADGLTVSALGSAGRMAVAGLVARGLLDGTAAVRGRVLLTRRGRLLADAVVRELTG